MERHVLEPDGTIWRYMDFGKFVSLVAIGSLWFAKAAEFYDDPFEGYCNVKYRQSDLKPGPEPIRTSVEEMLGHFSYNTGQSLQNARDHLYVNSWCQGEESMPMWQIYGAEEQGLAVKSAILRYKQAVNFGVCSAQYDFGAVEYHSNLQEAEDIQKDVRVRIPVGENLWSQMVQLAFHKRIGYISEREWRAVLYQDFSEQKGLDIPFDLDELIDEVYVGPRAPEFVFNAAKAVMERFGLNKPLQRSSLLVGPSKTGTDHLQARNEIG